MEWAAGIDVGGTTIKGLRLRADGLRVPYPRTVPTPHDVDSLVDAVAALARDMGERRLGVCVAGIVDEAAGVAVSGTNLPWANSPLRDRLSSVLGHPVVLSHDVRSGARAEARWGCRAGRFLYATLGTGLAAIPVVDGVPAPGPWGGELGQPLVPDPAEPRTLVSVERLCSAEAVARRYAERVPGFDPAWGAGAVFDRLAAGDSVAARVIDEAISGLAQALAFAVAMTAPDVVVLAGGMAQARAQLVEPLAGRLGALLGVLPRPEVVISSLGTYAQALGAAGLALDAPDAPPVRAAAPPRPPDA